MWLYELLYVLFVMSCVLMMLNLVISMMSVTHQKVSESADDILLCEHYNIMCSYEGQLSKEEKDKNRLNFALCFGEENDPTHIEIQSINRDWKPDSSAHAGSKRPEWIDKVCEGNLDWLMAHEAVVLGEKDEVSESVTIPCI